MASETAVETAAMTIAEVPRGTREDAQCAIGAANAASDAWAGLTAFESGDARGHGFPTSLHRQAAVLDTASGIGRAAGTAPMESSSELQTVVIG